MRKIKITLILGFALLISATASAHYMWIETAGEWKMNTPNTISIYYGEYEYGQLEKVDGRFSEVKGFTAWITDPVGTKVKLGCIPGAHDHYSATYTPTLYGTYTIEVIHTERAVVDWSMYDIGIVKPNYYATAKIKVAAPPKPAPQYPADAVFPGPDRELVIAPSDTNRYKLNRGLRFTVKRNDKFIPRQKLVVHAANGWSKELEPEKDGTYSFKPIWDGQYVLEAIFDDKTPGNYEGSAYQFVRHRATFTFKVKKT